VENAPEGVLFQVLGPFEAHVDGHAVPLGAARQRIVLAALVANANAVVSTDRLIDIVWGDDPPQTSLSTLQKYVYRLRGSLGDRILTRPPGYVLRLQHGESDASRFESLLVDAAGLATGGEVDEAITAFDAALALWRGPAWAEFADFDFARVEVARLEGLRATAIEDRAEVALAAGRHAEVIGELEANVAAYPLRERPRAQLMLALYRGGRHAEALRAYHAYRRYLGEEVGLEPSAELSQLADAILQQQPELDWAAPPGAGGRLALPSGTVTFVFTDIEGSTRLFRRLGHSYVEVLERHRRLVRAAVASEGGVEVSSEGDGLFFAFSNACAALAATVGAQQALCSEPWGDGAEVRVRMGVHTGDAVPHNGDYIALPVHQAARVRDAANGGQVLLTRATVEAIATMPPDCSVVTLGTFPVSDFDGGVELFEAHHPALPATFPVPRVGSPRRAAPLPAVLAADTEPLVGRATDLEWLGVLWERAVAGAAVTAVVCGPPGIGKSRLLAEFARRAHANGATVTVTHDGAAQGGTEPVVAVLDDFDGAHLPSAGRGVFVLAASSTAVGGTPNTRELRGLTADEVTVLLRQKVDAVTADLSRAIQAETRGNPRQVHDAARRLHERETEQRVQRALERVGAATQEARRLRDQIAGGVLELERAAATVPDEAMRGVCPYKGLARYEAADAPFFYGRERLVATLVARIAVDRFVGIIGASGSGKSSLVRAGLLPALSSGALPGSAAWPTCTCTPGEHPLRSLAESLAPLVDIPAAELARRLDRQPDELGAVLEGALRGREGGRVVVVVDQFEEVATLCRTQEERERFAGALVDAVTDPSVPAVVVPVVRADYYGALAVHPELARLFEHSQLLVGAMTDTELRRAVTEPARRAGLVPEDGLADAVCADAGSEPGALPLVSTAMAETWVRRDGTVLTLAGYRDAGGVHGALARLADDVYAGFDGEGQDLAQRLFLRLAEPGEGTDDVRRRMPRAEFSAGAAGDEVLDAFVGRRLLVADGGSVEVAHEALLREWPRLRSWLEEDRDGRRLHRHVTDAAAAWAAEGRDAGALYRGTRLGAAQDWAASHPDALNTAEREFLDASVEAQHSELRRARRTARRFRSLAGAMAVVLVVALVAGGLALVQRSRANHQAATARTAAVSAEAERVVAATPELLTRDRTEAGLLAAAAERVRPGADTSGALLTALAEEPRLESTISGGRASYIALAAIGNDKLAAAGSNGVDIVDLTHRSIRPAFDLNAIAVSATGDGRLIAAGSQDKAGTVVLWDPVRGAADGPPLHFGAPIADLAFSPDGRTLAVALGAIGFPAATTPANTPRLVDVASRATSRLLGGLTQTAAAVAFTPDGKDVLTGGNDGLVITHDARTGAADGAPIDFHAGVFRLAASPDGHDLVVTGSGIPDVHNQTIARTYDAATGAVIKTITGDEALGQVAFDSAGHRLVLTGIGGAQVFDAPSFAPHGAEISTENGAFDAVFVPSGRVALAGADGTITLWGPDDTVASGRAIPGSADGGGQFSPNGAVLAVAGRDDVVTVYRTRDLLRLGTVSVGTPGTRPEQLSLTPLVFSPDGRTLAVGDRIGRVRFFDTTTLRPLGPPLQVASAGITSLAYSPGGTTVVATSAQATGDNHVIDVATGTSQPLGPAPSAIDSPEFSPDGRRLLEVSLLGDAVEYPVVDGVPGPGRDVSSSLHSTPGIAYSPDGRMLAAGTTHGGVAFYDAATLRPLGPAIAVSGQALVVMTFSPDGHYLATEDYTNTVRLVDVARRAVVGAALAGGHGYGWLGFSPDSTELLLPGPAGSVLLDLDVPAWLARACQRAGRDLTAAEVAQYFPSAPHVHACS
jgi:DNA-binding SARP family transcriptional activator/WD40 repeat protein/energy-coupling factor transporter ATP-binding protein EcfA2